MSTSTMTMPAAQRVRRSASLSRDRRWALITSYVFLVIFAIFFLVPPYYMIVTALKPEAEIAHMDNSPWWISQGITFENFLNLITQTEFLVYFKNTVIVTVLSLIHI